MKFKSILIVAVIAFVAIGAYVWFFVYNKSHTDYQEITARYNGSAQGFYDKAKQDEQALRQDYLNQAVVVSGIIKELDGATIILEPNLSCKLNDGQNFAQVAGEEIKLKGRFVGLDEDLLSGEMVVNLDQCSVLK